jgi:hypothetical protein
MSVGRNPLEISPKFQVVSGDRLLFGRHEFDRQFFFRGAEGDQIFGNFGRVKLVTF